MADNINELIARTVEPPDENNEDPNFGSDTIVGVSYDDGTLAIKASDDILKGQAYKMYDNPQHLVGIQEQYQPRPGSRKIINFKQDYVILIRKKLFYAANAANQQVGAEAQTATDDGSITQKGHYMRTYKIDNFTSISLSHSILSSGTCSISLKGAERVMCYEHGTANSANEPSIDDMINDMENHGIGELIEDNYDSMDKHETNATDPRIAEAQANASLNWLLDKNGQTVGNRIITTIGGYEQTETTSNLDYGQEGLTNISLRVGNRQNPLNLEVPTDYTIDIKQPEAIRHTQSQWKFAEKCDFEPMDEIWIFGKSNFERSSTGDFKMNQLFFGYINDVKKTHQAGATSGCTMTITGKDQLKMLELSWVSTQPTMTAGASMNGTGIDLRWGRQDAEHFGTVELFNPYEVIAVLGERGADQATEEEKRTLESLWASMTLQNIFGGLPLEKIIRQLCLDAGIPPWYLTKRIEAIQFPPFTFNVKQAASDQMFSAAGETRLSICRKATNDLMLEFFADEEGNIVLKCPNYALGANVKVANNMGFSQLKGGLLNSPYLGIKNMTNSYWAVNEEDITKQAMIDESGDQELVNKGYMRRPGTDANTKANEKKGEILGSDGVYVKDPSVLERLVYTREYKNYLYAQGAQRTAEYFHGDINHAQYALSGSSLTDPIADRLNRGTVNITVEPGQSLYSLAEQYLGNGERYTEIFNDNVAAFSALNASPQELSKLNGRTITINTHLPNDNDKSDYARYLENQTEYWRLQADQAGIYDTQYIKDGSITKQKFEATKHRWYDHTLSELTDELIPEIPQEYILGFTLTDSDEHLFNMYEVNITGDWSPFDSAGPIQQIRRVFPDLNSMIRFGCRPSPRPINFPHMGNKANAHLLAYMLCAKSVAERNSATLNMIEDSSIRIGNPIRFLAYDEHPNKPLASQEQGTGVSSALSDMSNSQKNISLQEAANSITRQVQTKLAEAIANSTQTVNLQTETGGSVEATQSEGQLNNILYDDGDDANGIVGETRGSTYKGVGASWLAQQTDAQSIYYVSAIRRDIQIGAKQSTMTLTLTHGRMLGKPSVIDQMMLLYKTYYDTNVGYCPDLSDLMAEYKKYKEGDNEQEYVIKAKDTLVSIAKDTYGIDISQPQLKPVKQQTEEDLLANPHSTFSLKESNDFDQQTYGRGWHQRTYETEGTFYKVANGGTGGASAIGSFKIYVYDNDRSRFVYDGVINANGETTSTPEVSNETQVYSDFLKQKAHEFHRDLNKNSQTSGTPESATLPTGDAYVIKYKSSITTRSFPKSFKDETRLNTTQRQLQELKCALIALNTSIFGNSLAQSENQINMKLQENINKKIWIPKNLILTDETTGAASKPINTNVTTDNPLSPFNDPDIIWSKTITNGQDVTRIDQYESGSITKDMNKLDLTNRNLRD